MANAKEIHAKEKMQLSIYDLQEDCFAGQYTDVSGNRFEVAASLKDGMWTAFNPYLMGDGDFPVTDKNPMVAIKKYIKIAKAVEKYYGTPWIK